MVFWSVCVLLFCWLVFWLKDFGGGGLLFDYFYYSSYWYNYFQIDNTFEFGEWKINISYQGESYEHSFAIFDNYGDVNFDGFLNVLDLVIAVELVINENYNRMAYGHAADPQTGPKIRGNPQNWS